MLEGNSFHQTKVDIIPISKRKEEDAGMYVTKRASRENETTRSEATILCTLVASLLIWSLSALLSFCWPLTLFVNNNRYFRQYGECAPCPSNPWMIVAILLGGATTMGTIALIMKKRRVSLGIMSIAVDYFQILALLSSTKTPWPQIIRDLYTWLSAFNFNINITAPECVFEVKFEDKWRMQICFPFLLLLCVFVYNWTLVFIKKYIFGKRGRKVYSHSHRSVGIAMSVLYYLYLNLSMVRSEP